MLHLNNAGASLASDRTLAIVTAHFKLEQMIGPYEAAQASASALSDAKVAIGELVNYPSAQIAIADSATRAWNSLIYGVELKPGDVVVTSQLEFGSMLASLVDHCRHQGATIRIAPTDNAGRIDVERLNASMGPDVKLIAVAHAPAHLPLLNPVERIDALASSYDVPVLFDACQTAGLVTLPKLKSRRSAICGTGRKWLRGPRGTGFLAVTEAWAAELKPPTVDLANSDAENLGDLNLTDLKTLTDGKRFELWERNIAVVLGLGNAVREALAYGVPAIEEDAVNRAIQLKGLFSGAVASRLVCGNYQETPVLCLKLSAEEAEQVGTALKAAGLNHSIMSPWDAPIDFQRRGLAKILRLSPHYFTSASEITAAADILNRDAILGR